MKWIVVKDYDELSELAARRLLDLLHERPASVVGLPTGHTPEGMYRRVVADCSTEYHCFLNVITFNLDEYVGLPPDHPGSYCAYMHRNLFNHVDIDPKRIHVPDGLAARILARDPLLKLPEALTKECLRYEEEIREVGGLDLTFLGLGRNGHIGFNEPGASFESRTRVISLDESTRKANAKYFEGGKTPEQAITMGIATILESRSIVLLASGSSKAEAVRRLATGEITEDFPASALHKHLDVTVIVDRDAAP